jgi:hypothetical protein
VPQVPFLHLGFLRYVGPTHSPAGAGTLLPPSSIRLLVPNLFPFNDLQKILDNDCTFEVTYLVSSTLHVAVSPPLPTSLFSLLHLFPLQKRLPNRTSDQDAHSLPSREFSAKDPEEHRDDRRFRSWRKGSLFGANPLRINTCKSVSKQRTLTLFRINTYKKQGGGGVSLLPTVLVPCSRADCNPRLQTEK